MKLFLEDFAGKLHHLESQAPKLMSNTRDRAAGLPRMLFFCISHKQGLVCAASQPSYITKSPLEQVFECIRFRRFRDSLLQHLLTNDRERRDGRPFEIFDHSTELGKPFILKSHECLVFTPWFRCSKCFVVHKYKSSSKPKNDINGYEAGYCAEDLCHDYCTREPVEGMVQDTTCSFF